MKLLFSTGNDHKVAEARQILTNYDVEQVSLDYPELQADLETVARTGAEWCFEQTGKPVFVEDSGIFVDALNGFPGPYSAYVYDTLGNPGILRLLNDERAARFTSVVAYCDGTDTTAHVGTVHGTIAPEERGDHGFGYDPIFIPSGSDRTFAQDPATKNEVSHRKRALTAFAEYLEQE